VPEWQPSKPFNPVASSDPSGGNNNGNGGLPPL
jgi:hypothetical protein